MPSPTKKRRKPVTITRAVALERVDQMMRLVLENVKIGLHQEAALRTANTVVRSSVPSDRYLYGAECYNTIRNSLALNLVLTLARLFDEGNFRKSPCKQARCGVHTATDQIVAPEAVQQGNGRPCKRMDAANP